MSSGILPPNACVTLEHEYVLVFRNGTASREFEPGTERRYKSAYFWEERNRWFSDVWTDVNGEHQSIDWGELRERFAAYPFEIPYRLISMYSVYGDTVLDPFWGTGTTPFAAIVAGRNSIGSELDAAFVRLFDGRVENVPEYSRGVIGRRLNEHESFVKERMADGKEFEYEADNYEFPVTTAQEKSIQFFAVSDVRETEARYVVSYDPVEETDVEIAATK
jgi:DNA modification methylase